MMLKADGFIGSIMAAEGVSDMTTLLHGPDGCRKNLTTLSRSRFPKGGGCDMGMPFTGDIPQSPAPG